MGLYRVGTAPHVSGTPQPSCTTPCSVAMEPGDRYFAAARGWRDFPMFALPPSAGSPRAVLIRAQGVDWRRTGTVLLCIGLPSVCSSRARSASRWENPRETGARSASATCLAFQRSSGRCDDRGGDSPSGHPAAAPRRADRPLAAPAPPALSTLFQNENNPGTSPVGRPLRESPPSSRRRKTKQR